MLYVVICKDKPSGGLTRRMETRATHLAYLESLGVSVRAAGAMLSDDGTQPCGSLIIIDAANLEEARAIAAADPYGKADVFESVEVRPLRLAMGDLGK